MVGARRGVNFTAAELESFLDTVEEVMPLSATHWENVAATHMARYPEAGRNVGSLRRKFKELYSKKVSTGDPNCPPSVRRAKRLKQGIVELMDGTDLQSNGDAADDSMPGLGEGEGMPGLGEGNNNNDGDGDDALDDNDNDNGVLFNDNGVHPDDEVAAANAAVLNAPPAAVARPQSRAGSIGSASRGQGVSRRRAGTHLTPINRPRTRQRETSPEDGPGDRIGNIMGIMMMNNASEREERREEREERRQEFRLQMQAQQQQQQQQNMMMMVMMGVITGNGRNVGGMANMLGAGVNANAGGTVNMLDGGENNNADGNGGGGAVRGGEDNTGNNTD